jgi:hypothetical protein
VSRAPTTPRIEGTSDTSRSTRRIRKARKTLNAPLAGISAIPTTAKSNTRHGSWKKRLR